MSNHLAFENSPYLLQHASNPVEWYPWSPEALEKARLEDKPIFLSIGYAACHWCHVMAHESFENADTAAVMNEHYVNIKVDREERPDLDSIYMDAVVAMTGRGGWPMSVFLFPDGKPFYVMAAHIFRQFDITICHLFVKFCLLWLTYGKMIANTYYNLLKKSLSTSSAHSQQNLHSNN